jgi:hypothetical protein
MGHPLWPVAVIGAGIRPGPPEWPREVVANEVIARGLVSSLTDPSTTSMLAGSSTMLDSKLEVELS